MSAMRYAVRLARHGTVRCYAAKRDAIHRARCEWRDGWPTVVVELSTNREVWRDGAAAAEVQS